MVPGNGIIKCTMGVVSFSEGREGLVDFEIYGEGITDQTVFIQCRKCPLEGNGCSGLSRRYSIEPHATIRRNYFEVREAIKNEKFVTWCGILVNLRLHKPDLKLGLEEFGA